MKNNKKRAIWWNFTADISRFCGYLLWVQRLIPATLSHCVQYCIITERIATVPSVVLLAWDRIMNVVSCSGLSLVRRQATFWNHVDFLANCDKIYGALGHHGYNRKTTVEVIIRGICWILYKGSPNWYFCSWPLHTTLESKKKRLSAISIIETEWSTYASPEQGHCWFRQWLVTCLMPSHYLNQCRIIIKIDLRQISSWKVTNCRLLIVGHFVSASMFQCAWNTWFGMSYIAINLSKGLGFLSLMQICCSIFIFHLR